ncbi:MAG: deiodinase-like protein, partial [Planctomycetota bacterium]
AVLAAALTIPAWAEPGDKPRGERGDRQQTDRPERPERQRGQRGGGRQLQRIQQVLRQLDLTEEQQTQVRAILDEARTTMAEKREALADMSPEQRREEMRAFGALMMERIGAVLDDEQRQKLRQAFNRGGQRQQRPAAKDGEVEADEPADTPQARDRGQRGGRGAGIRTFFEATMQLELEREQRTEITAIGEELRETLEANDGDREAVRDAVMSARQRVMAILDDEQKQALREKMRELRGAAGERPRAQRENPFSDRLRLGADVAGQERPVLTAPDDAGVFATIETPDVTDLKLVALEGHPISLDDLADRPTVVVFGSITCPHFRDYAQALDVIRDGAERKVNWIWAYTREAHPTGANVRRNDAVGLSVRQHITLADRIALAERLSNEANLGGVLSVEAMDASIADELDTFPSGAVLINTDGEVVERDKWADPVAIGRWLESI